MRVTVAVASRRPLALVGSLMALWRLRSNETDIDFTVAVDDDDPATLTAAKHLQEELPLHLVIGKRGTLGEIVNRAVLAAKGTDLLTVWNDRAFVISEGWDLIAVKCHKKYPQRVLWWSCPWDTGCVMPIMPKAWLEAQEWRYSSEIFPFWYDDTAQQEIDLLVHGGPSLKIPATYSGARGPTTRGRDFSFWQTVFAVQRPQRLAIAQRTAAHLGLEWEDRQDVVEYFGKYDEEMFSRSAQFEKTFGDKREPDESYIAARKKAALLLAE